MMWYCIRCRTDNLPQTDKRGREIINEFGEPKERPKCMECGVGRKRKVRHNRRHKIGGKRGRNSGKVKQHGKKGGGK